MTRPLRIDYPGALHHITARGNRRGDIFSDDRDRYLLFDCLAETCRIYGWDCYAYCFMTNHYHLLVETGRATLSAGMRHLNGLFTQRFNRRHETVGHVFQGRFKSVLIQREAHLMEVCRYVVLNPVRAGLAGDPIDWRWSSYRATLGRASTPEFLDVRAVRSLFCKDEKIAVVQYHGFVMAGIGLKSPLAASKGGILGDEMFSEQVTAEASPGVFPASSEVATEQRFPARPDLARLFAGISGRPERDAAVLVARQSHGYGVSEIGAHLGLHYSTVSKIIRAPKGSGLGM